MAKPLVLGIIFCKNFSDKTFGNLRNLGCGYDTLKVTRKGSLTNGWNKGRVKKIFNYMKNAL